MKKSLIIKEEVHSMLKEYCNDKGLKINKMVENLIIKHVKDESEKMSTKNRVKTLFGL